MLYINTDAIDAGFYFSAEEYCMRHMDDMVVMFWQTEKSIMLGSNQIVAAEINLSNTIKHNVNIVRRPSGGGTIYTDKGTLLISVITPFEFRQDVKSIQQKVISEPLVLSLRQLGVPAEIKGRNDVVIGNHKISGMAQHIQNNKLCSHCSLLVNTDLSILEIILNPDIEKMNLKGIKSVKDRVVNIKDYLCKFESMDVFKNEFINLFLEHFYNVNTYSFSEKELRDVNAIKLGKYGLADWNFGKNLSFDYHYSYRFISGRVEIFLKIKNNHILDCKILGDFLNVLPIETFESKFVGASYQLDTIRNIINIQNFSLYMGGIEPSQLLHCFFAN